MKLCGVRCWGWLGALTLTACATTSRDDGADPEAAPPAVVVERIEPVGAAMDPLRARLLAREDLAMQNLLLARAPTYAYYGTGDDAPYFGDPVEPPLPDLNLLPEDLPPWEDFER